MFKSFLIKAKINEHNSFLVHFTLRISFTTLQGYLYFEKGKKGVLNDQPLTAGTSCASFLHLL